MKRWLLSWELGHGLGHLAALTAVARQALLHGIEPIIASSQPLPETVTLPAGARFLLAPTWPRVTQPLTGTSSMSELLFEQGFAQPDALVAKVQGWRDLIEIVGPSAVIVDHAPTALLTAKALKIPTVQLGTGFAVPPSDGRSAMPSFRDWEAPNGLRMAQAELAINKALLHAAARTGLPLSTSTAALYCAPAVIRSLPMLDHYSPSLRAACGAPSFCGPLELTRSGTTASGASRIPDWPGAAGHKHRRILAYLKVSHPLTLPVLNALASLQAHSAVSALVYVEGAEGVGNPHANIHIQNTPLPFKQLLQGSTAQPGATLVIHQGGIGASSQALLAGVPQLLLPDMAEAFITARTLVREQVAELLRPEASRERVHQMLKQMIDGKHYRDRATLLAKQNDAFAGDNGAQLWRLLTLAIPESFF
ncbi:MAG: hypothetical protein H7203_09570 [Rhizobacter sp.]|nr:hypothetical protein [Burkholderiales bacterium]